MSGKPRVDAYGKPLTRPTPVPILAPSRYASEANRAAENRLLALLVTLLQECCVDGWHGTLSLEVIIQDGTIHSHIEETIRRHRSA